MVRTRVDIHSSGGLRLDLRRERLWRGGREVKLRRKPFAVLRYLSERRGQLVARDELFRALWPKTHVTDTVLKVCVREIREALEDEADAPRFIQTVPREGYRWIAPLPLFVADRGESSSSLAQRSTIVGREAEVRAMLGRLDEARRGRRQVVFVIGEAGIGKTTVVDAFTERLRGEDLLIARGQSIEQYGPGEAYLAALAALGELCRGPDAERVISVLDRHAPTWLMQMPALVDEHRLAILERRTRGGSRDRMLREAGEALEVLTAEKPLVLILEDLQWSDFSTVDLLAGLARLRAPARLLVIATYRPLDAGAGSHPVAAVKRDLQLHGACHELRLEPLDERQIGDYLAHRFEQHRFPPELGATIHRGSGGNPLLVANVIDDLTARRCLTEIDGTWQLGVGIDEVRVTLPDGLRESIERQADRLSEVERRLLGAASVSGEEFLVLPVADVLGTSPDEIEVVAQGLARRGLFLRASGSHSYPNGVATSRYAFVHAVHQKVLYERLRSPERAGLHLAIAASEERLHGAQAVDAAAELATHFARASDDRRTVHYLELAGDIALRRFANPESIGYLRRALDHLARTPPSRGREEKELELLLKLGPPLVADRGFAAPEVVAVFTRALDLCRTVGDTPQTCKALLGLYSAHLTGTGLEQAEVIARRLHTLVFGTDRQDPTSNLHAEAHYALGYAIFYRGEIAAATTELEKGVASYDSARRVTHSPFSGVDPGVSCPAQLGWALWVQGSADRALEQATSALECARRLASPFSLGLALLFLATTHLFRREYELAERVADEGLAASIEHGLPYWRSVTRMCRGSAIAARGRSAEGIAELRSGLAEWSAVGMETGSTFWLSRLAEILRADGQESAAREALGEAFARVERNGERWWSAELHRQRGELLADRPKEAEACFRQALEIARSQGARALELRAATSFARHRRAADRADARTILRRACAAIREGHSTADLVEARGLLGELAAS